MKKKTFIVLFVSIHVSFIFLQIYKQSYLVGLSFDKQRLEKEQKELIRKKNQLVQRLQVMQNLHNVKEYASSQLHMQKIKLHQIKHLPLSNHDSKNA